LRGCSTLPFRGLITGRGGRAFPPVLLLIPSIILDSIFLSLGDINHEKNLKGLTLVSDEDFLLGFFGDYSDCDVAEGT